MNKGKKSAKPKGKQKVDKKGKKKGLWGLLAFLLVMGCLGSLTDKEKDNEPQQSIEESVTEEQQAAAVLTSEAATQDSGAIADGQKETAEPESKPAEAPTEKASEQQPTAAPVKASPVNSTDIPSYAGRAYVEINGNVPYFDDSELITQSFETYSNLDSLGRCGVAYANVGVDLMPTEERGSIGQVKPSGWHSVRYNGVVDGNYLYNRCHLIGYQLTAENANEKNLITGTRYFNTEVMLPFENMVADYIKETNNHVLYRVTPVFSGNNLVADGVLMEAKSVEDAGEGVLFNVFCYNVQPGVAINYADGSSQLDGTVAVAESTPSSSTPSPASSSAPTATPAPAPSVDTPPANNGSYAVNANNGKIHINGACAATGSGSNAMKNPVYFGTYEEAEAYSVQIAPGQDKRKCGNCW